MQVINEGGLVKLWAEGVHVEDQAREVMTAIYFVSGRAATGEDCSLFVEAASPENAEKLWVDYCDVNGFAADGEDYKVFCIPECSGIEQAREFFTDVEDVTP